ncbi:hypothetical protein ACLOJK_019028 [Asimina triloba]
MEFKLIAWGSHFSSLLLTVSRGLLFARASSPADASNNPLVKTKQQERRDAEILAEAKRITESHMLSKAAEEANLPIGPEGVDKAADSVSPSSSAQPTAIQDSAAAPASLCMKVSSLLLPMSYIALSVQHCRGLAKHVKIGRMCTCLRV